MNERIRELERQAEKFVMSIPASLDINEHTAVFNEKFAELIVRDCMDVVYGYTKPRTFDTHYDAVEQIRVLFGVEE